MYVLDTIAHRFKRGCETMAYPKGAPPARPDRHGGARAGDAGKCADGCAACVPVCPTEAITRLAAEPEALDLGRCIFCAACVEACPRDANRVQTRCGQIDEAEVSNSDHWRQDLANPVIRIPATITTP